MEAAKTGFSIDTTSFSFKSLCFGGYFVALAVLASTLELPYPYEKIPLGLFIGSASSLFFLGLLAIARPGVIIISAFTLFMLSMSGSLDWNPSVWHETHIIKRQTLTAGTVITALWVWWTLQGTKDKETND